jgi:hypothetical protein
MSEQQIRSENETKPGAFGRVRGAMRRRPKANGALGAPREAVNHFLDFYIRPF